MRDAPGYESSGDGAVGDGPLVRERGDGGGAAGAVPLAGSAPRRVLVVDDDATIQGFLAEALADEGYEARVAGSGRQALNVLRGWRPDLIVLDLMMPEMDGVAFRAEQRLLPDVAGIPVIVLSATRDLPERAREIDPAALFPKPMDLDQLLEAVDRLARPSGRQTAAISAS